MYKAYKGHCTKPHLSDRKLSLGRSEKQIPTV